ncbi:MAG: CCA tRNA nucleotidyltransferase [Bryobacterales bacterium]|nr:CCA tRNA nucleotidyltransferase [Bryobacterales bacterium]
MSESTTSRAKRTFAAGAVEALRRHGYGAWFVGGCVRDEVLGIPPKDYDIATSARPEQVLALFPRSEKVGAHFGVVLVKENGHCVEVATFRSDHSYSDGRHPDVVTFETDPRQDALRRDFTINSLFLDPFSGEVLDFTGGREDLREGVVRAIGNAEERFREDHLRILRAARFAARFGFAVEPETYAAMRRLGALLDTVSRERVREELIRMLTEGGARRGLELLDGCGLLERLLPEVKAFQGVAQPPEYHPEGDVWVHVMLMLELMGKATPTLAFGVLLHDVGKPPTFRVAERIRFDGHVEVGVVMARRILERLKCSGEQVERVSALVEHHMRFSHVKRMKQSTLKRFLRMPHFEEHLALHRLDCLSSHRNLESYEFARQAWENMPEEALRPPRLLTGDDLIAAGYAPGPLFKDLLRAVEDAQLEGRIHGREEALDLAAALRPPPLPPASGAPGGRHASGASPRDPTT